MKKALAAVLALLLCLSSCCALAEEANLSCTMDVDMPLEEILALAGTDLSDEEQAIMDMIIPLLKKMQLQAIIGDDDMQLSLIANHSPIVTLYGQIQGDQMVLLSDLIPSYYLTISQETIQTLLQEMAASLPDEGQMDDLFDFLGDTLLAMQDKLEAYAGDMETGEYLVNGQAFTAKISINITLERLCQVFLAALRDSLSGLTDSGFLSQAEVEGITKEWNADIAEMEQMEAENAHPCDFAIYGRPGDDAEIAITFAVRDENDLIALSMLVLNGEFSGYLVSGGSENASYEAMYALASSGMDEEAFVLNWKGLAGEDDSYTLDLSLVTAGMTLSLDFLGREAEDGMHLEFGMGLSPLFPELLRVKCNLEEGGRISMPISTNGRQALALEEILSSTDHDDLLEALETDMGVYGVANVMTNLVVAMPNETSQFLTQIMLLQQGTDDASIAIISSPTEAPLALPTDAPVTVPSAPASSGGFMDVIRNQPTAEPAATPEPTAEPTPVPAPQPTPEPIHEGFFNRPGN